MPVSFEVTPIPSSNTQAQTREQVITPPSQPMSLRKSPHRFLKWLVLLAAGMVLLVIGMIWWGNGSFSDQGVKLTIQGPEQINSGDEALYKLDYKNTTNTDLTNLRFRIFFPEDSTIIAEDGSTSNPESDGFEIDSLKAGDDGTKEFKMFVVGDKGSVRTMKVNMIFNAGSLRSSFEKEAVATTVITDVPVQISLSAPPTVVSGQSIQYTIDVRNTSNADISDLKLVITYPDGFVATTVKPKPDSGTTWEINSLARGASMRVTISGSLSGQEQETKTITAVLRRPLNDTLIDFVKSDATTVIGSPLLSLSIIPDEGRDYTSFAGDTLRYTVSFGNTSKTTITGLSLSVKLEGDAYDTAKINLSGGSLNDSTKTISFTASDIPSLVALSPRQTGTVRFAIPLKTSAGSGSVRAIARLSTQTVPQGFDGSEVSAVDAVVTKIGSQPTISQSALYDGGLGSGQLPLKVGQDTTLTIRWEVTNPGNNIAGTTISAVLPSGATWNDASYAGQGSLSYENASRRVVWQVGTISFGTGIGTARLEASFKVIVTPSISQVGQFVQLVGTATLSGTDSYTNGSISTSTSAITTGNIVGHSAEGRVVE